MPLIVVFGLPGSGKSYLSNMLVKRLKFVHVNTSEIRRRFNLTKFDKRSTAIVKKELFATSERLLNENKIPMLERVYSKKNDRQYLIKRFAKYGLILIYCKCNYSILKKRVRARVSTKKTIETNDLKVLEDYYNNWEPLDLKVEDKKKVVSYIDFNSDKNKFVSKIIQKGHEKIIDKLINKFN